MKWGKPRDSTPSRFLFELTGRAENAQSAKSVRPPRAKNKPHAEKQPRKTNGQTQSRRRASESAAPRPKKP
jgi:hypothetical protein